MARGRRRCVLATPRITEIVSFGSLTFLLVFGLINLLHARQTAERGLDRVLAYAGAAACIAAAGGLLSEASSTTSPAPIVRPWP